MADLQPYPAMKDSGVEWLGEVPAHWEVRRTRYLLSEVDQRSTTGEETHLSMSQRLGLVPSDKVQKSLVSESYIGGKLCRHEDLVLNRLKAHLGVFALARQPGVISPDYSVFRRKCSLSMAYVERTLRSPACRGELGTRAKGIVEGFWRLYTDDFFDIRLPLPPLPEQTAIVRYLNHVDRQVRRFVQAKQKLIKLLEEEKQALIHRAVTRGLDPDVPMKDSGVEWLGEVPAHWEVVPLRRMISLITSGSRGWAKYYSDEGDLFIQSGNLGRSMGLIFNKVHRVEIPIGAEGERTLVARDDVLVCITGALTGNVVHVAEQLQPAFVNQHVALMRPSPDAVAPRFLSYALYSRYGQEQLESSQYGGTKQGLGLDDVRGVNVLLPSLVEQQEICEFLDESLAHLACYRSLARREIALLHEYRTRLIADVVTGKLDVRQAAAGLPEESADLLEEAEG